EEAKESTDRQLTTSLYLSVAEIYAKYQPDDHVEGYLEQALEIEPRNLKASLRLERLYRGEQRWDDLVGLLESRIEAAATKEERVSAYLALAEVQSRHRGRSTEAAEAYKKALGIEPSNARALHALVDFYTLEENWQALIRVYENALRARPRGEPEIGMYLQIGMLWWKKLNNLESADEYWKRVRKAEPAHPAMLDFYRQLYAREPHKLLQVLGQAQKVEADGQRRAGLAVEMAQLAEKSSGGVEKAIDLWKGVLKVEPGHPQAIEALRRLYEQTEKWNALLELLKERVEAVAKDDVSGRVARLLEIVAIYRDKLNLDVMVINTYNNILQLAPNHTGALAALGQKYEAMGRWNDLIGVLQRTVEATSAPAEKAELYRRIASLWIEKFGNYNQAVKPLEELYALSPVDPETVARLRDIYGRRRSWRALIDLERSELERLTQPAQKEARRAKLMEIAHLASDRLGDAREAIALWNRLLELDETDGEALAALGALYEREKRWLAFIEVLRRQSALCPSDASGVKAQVVLLERIGALYSEKLQAPEQAIGAYQEIVRKLPTHAKALRTLRELFAQGGRFDDLERLYAESGQWEELCEVLHGVAERLASGEDAQRIRLYTRVAEVAARELKTPERAQKAYERILAVDPTHLAAAEALVPIYRGSEKWARLIATYEILLGHADSDDARLALNQQIRALCEEKLGSKGLAFSWCAKAWTIRPTDLALEGELERLAQEAEAWEELVELYGAAAASEEDPARRAERHRRLGRIQLQRLHRPDEARKHFVEVLAHQPDDEEALATLEQIFNQAEAWPELLSIYRKRLGSAELPRRLDLLFKIAWIEEEKLADPKACIATYRQVLDADRQPQTQIRALKALEKLLSASEAWGELAEVLERRLALLGADADAEDRAALELKLGELYRDRLGRRHDALAHQLAAFRIAPSHRPALTALEGWLLAAQPGDPEAAADRVLVVRLLLPLYEAQKDAPKIVECLEILLAACGDAPSARSEKLSLLRRLGQLVGRELGDPKRAYELAGRLFALDPADGENRREMADLADRLECPDDFAVRLGHAEEAAAKSGDTALARALAWDLGQLFDARLGMPDEAEAAYRRVLERDPESADAYVALVQLYSMRERFSELRALIESKKARTLDSEARLGILYQISDLDEGVVGDADAAVRDYLEILELEPGSERAFRALDRLYSAAERWRDLDGLLEKRMAYAPAGGEAAGTPDSRAHLKFRRGDLSANRLEQPVKAADLFEEALSEEPKHEGAKKGLESLMKRPELRQRIARALEPIYAADEAWPKLALALGAQREAAEGKDAAELLARLAELQEERLGARQLALATWREALRVDPSEKRCRDHVERLATLLGRLPELAAAWEEAILASDPSDLQLRGELLEKVAELYEYELREVDRARGAWRRLLDLDPTNLHTSRPAAAALARLYEAQESWPELIEVLHRQADWTDPVNEKKELLFRIGRIQEELTVDPSAAIRTYREVLECDPEDRPALDALERLHHAQRHWPELASVLRRRLDLERAPDVRRELQWRIAALTERELGDVGEAIAGYHAILEERPSDLPALEALARLYEAEHRNPDLLDILERQLALSAERIPLRMRIADLLEGFGRRDQALERYREILDEDPRHEGARAGLERLLDDDELRLRAAEVLEPHYQTGGELDKLVRLSELWAEHALDPRERITRLKKVAELKQASASSEGAFDALRRAALVAVGEPDLPQLLDRLEKLALETGKRAELVALYRELGPDILDAATQERVYFTVAAASHQLADRATAREYYRRVVDTSPDHVRALDALEGLYAEGREWDPLFEIYARRAELAGANGNDERRREYLMKLAQLSDKELDRPTEAMRAYEQVLELYPAAEDASRALEQHYTAAHRHADLADLLEKRLGFADDLDEAVALRFRLATIYDEDLRDDDRAVDNYRAALGGDPGHEGAIRALERYLDDDTHRVSAAEVLEPVYVARHDWPRLARIYQIRLEAADDPRLRLNLTRRIARLYEEQLEDLDGAFIWYGKVFREEPADRQVRDQLGRLAGILDGWARLARIYEEWLTDGADPAGEAGAITIEILRALGSIYHARLEDVEGAKGSYRRLLQIDPGDEVAFVNLEKLLTGARRFSDLIETYREAAEATLDADRRKQLTFKQAAIEEEELHDPEAAVELFRAVLDLDGDDARALGALDRLYTGGKRWHDLVELLLRRLERADGPAWVALELRLGAVFESELEDRPAAIDTYEEVLARSPGHPDAVRSLERLIVDHDHTFRIAQILEPIYREQDAWQKLVVIYDAELEFIDDRPRRVELQREIARLHEQRGGDGRLAFPPLARAWSEEASEPESREAELYAELYRLARGLGMWRELESTLEEAVQKTYDTELLAKVWSRIAEIRETQLADPNGAIGAWRTVTQAQGEDDSAWQALERLLEPAGRPKELVAVLEKRATLAGDPEAEKALTYRAAALYEGPLQDREAAISTWQRVLALDDNDRGALEALGRLYPEEGKFRELTDVLGRQIELVTDEAERRALRFRLAGVCERELHDPLAAIDAYRAALAADPTDRDALGELARLYEGERMWPDHLEALDALFGLATETERAIELHFRAAEVTEKQLGDVEGAIDRYRQVLDVAPAAPGAPFHAGARAALERLARDEATRAAAALVLEPFYQARGEHAALVELTELRLAAASDPTERRALFEQIAALNERGLQDLQAAFAAWGRVLAEEPGDAAAQAELERLSELQGAPAELARLYEERLQAAFDPDVQRTLAWKLGVLYETRIADDERAIRAYTRALELPGEDGPASAEGPLAALDRLLTRASRFSELGEVLEKESEIAADPEAQAEFLHRLGELRLGELVDHDGALTAFQSALERLPSHAGARAGLERLLSSPLHAEAALDLLEPLYQADGDHEKCVALAEARLALTPSPSEKAALLERIAERLEKDLHDPARALDAIERALLVEPVENRLADEAERLARAAGQPGRAGEIFEHALGQPDRSPEVRRELGLRSARLWERLADPRAEARYRDVLAADPECAEALEALERIYRGSGDAAQLAEILERRAHEELDASAKKRHLAEAAGLHESSLHDLTAAVAGWRKVLDVDEADAQALDALARLYESAGRYHELVELLAQKARFEEDPAAQVGLKARIAALWAEKLGDLDQAAQAYRELLDVAPESLSALESLEDLERRRQDFTAVQEVLVRRLQAVGPGAPQIPVYRKLAALALAEQHSPEDAIGYLHEILALAPDEPEATAELTELLERSGKFHDLIDVLGEQATRRGQAGDAEGEVALLVRAADLWEQKLESPESATEILERILERDPSNVRALASLARIYEGARELDKCRATLEKALTLAKTPADAAELHFRIGRLESDAHGDEAGEPFYAAALVADPAHSEAALALETLARARGDWAKVAELLAGREERTEPGERLQLYLELSQVLVDKLGEPQVALPYLERAAKVAPDDPSVLEPLADIYFASGRLDDAQPLYQTLAERMQKGRRMKDVGRLRSRVAAIAESRGDLALALTEYAAAHQIDPAHAPTLAALGRLHLAKGEWDKARGIYRKMLLQNLDPQAGITKAEVYLHLGEIHEQQGEAPKAVGMYERGLELDAGHAGLRAALSRVKAQ
ncbi:MAG TPA: tetratricopeptide repeat protein, partial [Polyangia bacterium]